jgi:hypothetical protein
MNCSNQYKPNSISGMGRGLTGVMSSYAFIGVLLGVLARLQTQGPGKVVADVSRSGSGGFPRV